MRWIRTAIAKLTGRPPPASGSELTPTNFALFAGKNPDGTTAPRPSKKPFIVFMLAVFGLPYLMGKLIKALARSQEDEQRRLQEANPMGYPGDGQQIDPSKLEFCRVAYDFTPDTNNNAVQGVDLAVKKGDLVAVLSKTDPLGNPSEWWKCRSSCRSKQRWGPKSSVVTASCATQRSVPINMAIRWMWNCCRRVPLARPSSMRRWAVARG